MVDHHIHLRCLCDHAHLVEWQHHRNGSLQERASSSFFGWVDGHENWRALGMYEEAVRPVVNGTAEEAIVKLRDTCCKTADTLGSVPHL